MIEKIAPGGPRRLPDS